MKLTLHSDLYKRAPVALLLALGLAVSSPAHAWFFFFIPLGLFTGKGDTCVSNTAKVGDLISKPDGSTVVIKSLSGTTVRCSNASYPILAEVEASTGSLPDNISQARIDIPDGWVQQPVTEALKAGGVVMYALNKSLDAGVQLATWKRSGIASTSSFVSTRKANQITRLKESVPFPTEQLSVGGQPAWRYELSGRAPNGIEVKYTATLVEGEQEIVGVLAWTSTSEFDNVKPKLVAIADSITGIGRPSLPLTLTPATASSIPGPEETTATAGAPSALKVAPPAGPHVTPQSPNVQKLRELNELYKDGVITREEFESKKKQLLDNL